MALSDPPVDLELALPSALAPLADPGEPAHEQAAQVLREGLSEVLRALGLPGEARATIVVSERVPDVASWARLSVNGHRCRFGMELSRHAIAAARGAHDGELGSDPERLVAWLRDELAGEGPVVTAFMRAAITAVLGEHARAIVSEDVVAAYADRFGRSVDTDRLAAVVRHAVGLRVSVADVDTVVGVLEQTAALETAAAAEAAVAELRPPWLDLRLSEALLRELTISEPEMFEGLSGFLRNALSYELGLDVPPLWIVRAPLPDRHFALTVNHLPLLAHVALEPAECLVNEAPDRLGALVGEQRARAAVRGSALNPGSGFVGARVDREAQAEMEAAGLVTWTPLGHAILAIAADVRSHAGCLVDTNLGHALLGRLEYEAPGLVRQARERIPEARLARAMRTLATEQESSRNLPAILDRLLEVTTADDATDNGLDEAVRHGLSPGIAMHHARGAGTIVVYLLDPEIERLVSAQEPLAEAVEEEILAAIHAEVSRLAPSVPVPSLLTEARARVRLRELISPELPRMAVLSYDDLPHELNVQPVARILLSSATPGDS